MYFDVFLLIRVATKEMLCLCQGMRSTLRANEPKTQFPKPILIRMSTNRKWQLTSCKKSIKMMSMLNRMIGSLRVGTTASPLLMNSPKTTLLVIFQIISEKGDQWYGGVSSPYHKSQLQKSNIYFESPLRTSNIKYNFMYISFYSKPKLNLKPSWVITPWFSIWSLKFEKALA